MSFKKFTCRGVEGTLEEGYVAVLQLWRNEVSCREIPLTSEDVVELKQVLEDLGE